MDSALDRLDAATFLQIWQHFDKDDKGFIEGKKLEDFFRHMLQKLGMKKEEITEEKTGKLRERFPSAHNAAAGGNVQIQELATMLLREEENFLLLFRRETPLNNSVEFMRIWRNYDTDSSGYISANELKETFTDMEVKSDLTLSRPELHYGPMTLFLPLMMALCTKELYRIQGSLTVLNLLRLSLAKDQVIILVGK
ncbi:secretagogin [Nematolebias whitei]|uniref:secretagogin n=1 Tax=Nematolebias whitei TaxID=451745 RepID=UPI001899EF93|nr:secretagogin [Nematolebias whitei]